MTKKQKTESLEDEFYRKEKKTPLIAKLKQLLFPPRKPKPVTDVKKIKMERPRHKVPVSFNVGLAGIMIIAFVGAMIVSGSILIWGISIPTLYGFGRYIYISRVDKKAIVEE